EYLGLEGAAGLTDVLIERADLDDVVQPYGTDGLEALGAGSTPPDPSELLAAARVDRVLRQPAAQYAYALIATPAAPPVTDAVVLSTKVDGVLVLAGTTIVKKEQLSSTLDALGAVDGRLLGLVLNRVGHKVSGGYGGYYGYYSDEGQKKSTTEPVGATAP